jgi:acetyltransferase
MDGRRGRRYPSELVERHTLGAGQTVLLRPVRPGDEDLVQSFVRGLSAHSRYQRFHYAMQELSPEMLKRATHVDYRRHLALIAEPLDAGAAIEIGAARYVMLDGAGRADFALVVADRWQGRGLGRLLLGRLMAHAAERGVRWLEGRVLADNRPMLALAERLGFQLQSVPGEARVLAVIGELRRAAAAA